MTPAPLLTKADTVALWHAIQWMESVLRNWRRDGFADGSQPQYDHQSELLLQAKRALRKANAIRKNQQVDHKPAGSAGAVECCRPTKKLQADQKTAGGAGA